NGADRVKLDWNCTGPQTEPFDRCCQEYIYHCQGISRLARAATRWPLTVLLRFVIFHFRVTIHFTFVTLWRHRSEVDKQSELPVNGAFRVRIIRAEVSSFDPRSQVVSKRWDCLADFSARFLNTFGDGTARSFGVRRGLAILARESDS